MTDQPAPPPPTEEELAGAKMIQALQRLAGIDESDEVSLKGWRGLDEYERKMTLRTYKRFCQ